MKINCENNFQDFGNNFRGVINYDNIEFFISQKKDNTTNVAKKIYVQCRIIYVLCCKKIFEPQNTSKTKLKLQLKCHIFCKKKPSKMN